MARYDSGTYAVEPNARSTSAIYAIEFGVSGSLDECLLTGGRDKGACPFCLRTQK